MIQGHAISSAAQGMAVKPPREAYALRGGATDGEEQLRKQVGKFISGTFFSLMLRSMRDTVPKDGLLSGGRGEEIFRSFFDRELADRFSEGDNLPQVEAAIRQLSGRTVYHAKMPRRVDDPAIGK